MSLLWESEHNMPHQCYMYNFVMKKKVNILDRLNLPFLDVTNVSPLILYAFFSYLICGYQGVSAGPHEEVRGMESSAVCGWRVCPILCQATGLHQFL